MKAVICTKYGPPEVLQIKEVDRPVPKNNEILVKIFAIPIATEDPIQRKGKPYFTRPFFGLTKPKKSIMGAEFSGEIEAVGEDVKLFKEGDPVFGHSGFGLGCYAEYVCMPEEGLLSIKPQNISNEEAAPICASMAAWNFLRAMADVQSGQQVLINGASGAVGTAAVQMAKLFGAEVTGVCSTANMELVKSLGADRVIDYTIEDFTENDQIYDIIFDVADKRSFSECKTSLKKSGIYLSPVLKLSILIQMFWTKLFSSKKVMWSATGLQPLQKRQSFLKELVKLFEAGNLKTIIDKSFKLEQIVQAHRYVESRQKRGNVVLTMI
jgi:NADPH:quinone reductase-like Zn-dependent oxidoreductase